MSLLSRRPQLLYGILLCLFLAAGAVAASGEPELRHSLPVESD